MLFRIVERFPKKIFKLYIGNSAIRKESMPQNHVEQYHFAVDCNFSQVFSYSILAIIRRISFSFMNSL